MCTVNYETPPSYQGFIRGEKGFSWFKDLLFSSPGSRGLVAERFCLFMQRVDEGTKVVSPQAYSS
jgi:hypothetical protein